MAAVDGGARAVGFVFYPPSPRAITADIAAELARMLPTGSRAVGLFVDAGDDQIRAITARVPLDLLQLHGGESPRRVAEIRDRFGLPVMKANTAVGLTLCGGSLLLSQESRPASSRRWAASFCASTAASIWTRRSFTLSCFAMA